MKKILTSLALLGAVAGGAYAQKTADLAISEFFPQNDSVYANLSTGDTFYVGFIITNNGTDAVAESDTIDVITEGYWIGESGTSYTNDYIVTGVNIPSGASDTALFYAIQGENIGYGTQNGAADSVYITWPTNATVDVNFWMLAWDADGNLFTDDGVGDDPQTVDDITGNNTMTLHLTFGDPTGISEINYKKESLNIYPNPANANVNVKYNFTKATEAGIRVVDVTGRTVINNNLGKQAAGEKVFTVDVSSLAPGMYTVELVTDDVRAISKLTVTK